MKLLVLLLLPCLSLSELSPGFGKCKQFFVNNVPPEFTPLQNKPPPQWVTTAKEICQCVWDNNKQQKYVYATLYNTDWRIPIYSAYVFKWSIDVGRVDPWYIEPQLDGYAEPCMAPEANIQNIGNNQAVNDDYKDQDLNKPKYDRGHLYPVQHTDDPLSMLATSTLTNAAPQDSVFNQGAWKKHEADVIKDLKGCESEAYVVTGVVPDHKIKLNNRVTVSEYYWRATCCLMHGMYTGKAYFGPNQNNEVQLIPVKALEPLLIIDYGVRIELFPGLDGCY